MTLPTLWYTSLIWNPYFFCFCCCFWLLSIVVKRNDENQNLKIIRVPKDILLNGNQFSWWETWLHFLFYKCWFNTDCVSWKSPTTLAPSNAVKIIPLILYLWALHQNVIISWNIKETFPIFIFCQVRGLGLYFNSAFKMRSRETALFPLRGCEFGWWGEPRILIFLPLGSLTGSSFLAINGGKLSLGCPDKMRIQSTDLKNQKIQFLEGSMHIFSWSAKLFCTYSKRRKLSSLNSIPGNGSWDTLSLQRRYVCTSWPCALSYIILHSLLS